MTENPIACRWEVVTDLRCELGEGPLWDPIQQCILWIDIAMGKIYQYHGENGRLESMEVGQKIGAIAAVAGHGLVAALKHGFVFIDWACHTVEFISDPEAHLENNRFNDGKCDPAGRFWAGTMDEVENKKHAGKLYALNNDLSVSVKIEGVSCSNGLAWSPDHRIFYYIDTPTRQVVAYDYQIETGEISHKRVVIHIPPGEGIPDGMTTDAEGMLWVAHWNGWKVSRWDPFEGRLLTAIHLPVSHISSCAFGGEGLDDLYITSARAGLSENDLKAQPLAGALFVVKRSGFTGLNAFAYRGS